MSFDYRKKDIIWTASDYSPAIAAELPYIELFGSAQTAMGIQNSIANWTRILESNGIQGIYIADPDYKSHYRLPFFSEKNHLVNNTWDDVQEPIAVASLMKMSETVGKIIMPSAGIIKPKQFTGSSTYSYEVIFQLLNTISVDGIKKNKAFIEQITQENLHQLKGSLGIFPPHMYQAYIPGVRWSPVCVVTNLTINNKGTLNIMPDFPNYIIPDIWEVQIQLTELIQENQDMYNAAIGGYSSINGIPASIKVFADAPLTGE